MTELADGLTEKRLREALEDSDGLLESALKTDLDDEGMVKAQMKNNKDALALPKSQAERIAEAYERVFEESKKIIVSPEVTDIREEPISSLRKAVLALALALEEIGERKEIS